MIASNDDNCYILEYNPAVKSIGKKDELVVYIKRDKKGRFVLFTVSKQRKLMKKLTLIVQNLSIS